MAGYVGTKAVLLSTTGADIAGDADVSGALDVGGGLTVDNDGSTVLTVDRATSDGTIIDLQKSGSSVGVVGAFAGDFIVGSTSGSDAAFRMDGTNNVIYASNTSGNARDNAIDLGASTVRWKDLYLSGGVYLGGVGSANHLSDYETGNWTPTYLRGGTATYTINSGRYTKVGNLVHLQCHLDINSLGTASGDAEVIGLPFTAVNDNVQYASVSSIHGNAWAIAADNLNGLVIPNSTKIFLYRNTGSPSAVKLNHQYLGTGNLLFNVTYRTDA